MSYELVKRLRNPPLGTDTSERLLMKSAADRIAALEAALSAALERLDASLFTNAEHQQAKDILREARK
jgi:hypothetical protein